MATTDTYTTAPAIGKDETLLIQGDETIAVFVCNDHQLVAEMFASLVNEEMDATVAIEVANSH